VVTGCSLPRTRMESSSATSSRGLSITLSNVPLTFLVARWFSSHVRILYLILHSSDTLNDTKRDFHSASTVAWGVEWTFITSQGSSRTSSETMSLPGIDQRQTRPRLVVFSTAWTMCSGPAMPQSHTQSSQRLGQPQPQRQSQTPPPPPSTDSDSPDSHLLLQ
jgi:hypothetical protein